MEKRLREWNVFLTWDLCFSNHVVKEALFSVTSVGGEKVVW